MIVRCKTCKRKYDNQKDADACYAFHSLPFKYENDDQAIVMAAGIKGIISRPTKIWGMEHTAYCWVHPFSTKALKTGSNFYFFCPIDRSFRSTKCCIHEDDITEILVSGDVVKAGNNKVIDYSHAVREKYGKAIKYDCGLEPDGFGFQKFIYKDFEVYVNKDGITVIQK